MDQSSLIIWIALFVVIAGVVIYYYYNKETLIASGSTSAPVQVTQAPVSADSSATTPADASKAVAALAEAAASSSAAPVANVQAAGAMAADACSTQAGTDAVSALCKQAVTPAAGDQQKVASTANIALADINGEIQGAAGGNYASVDLGPDVESNQILLPGVSPDVAAFDASLPSAETIADNFINAGSEYNIDTIVSSNKNANLDLRGRPPIKFTGVAPGNLSSWALDQNDQYDLSNDPEYKISF